jgi:endonuclease/exonuclease/phosphatase family metal-dependent hydrolase
LFLQIGWAEPLVPLVLAMVGTVFFMLFLPTYAGRPRLSVGRPEMALGMLVGLVLDTALHGAFSTYGLVWQTGWKPMLITSALVVTQWILLTTTRSTARVGEPGPTTNYRTGSAGWLAIGPFLFLQMVVFQNIARVAVLTGWPLPWAFGWTMLAQLAGLGIAVYVFSKESRNFWPLALVAGGILVAASMHSSGQDFFPAAQVLLIGQICLTLLFTLVLTPRIESPSHSGAATVSPIWAPSMILFLVLIVGYYVAYLVNLPYGNTVLETFAALFIASCALVPGSSRFRRGRPGRRAWVVFGSATALLLLPIAGILSWQEPVATKQDGFPVRVMTYNLHSGFNAKGALDIEAIAQVIEKEDPDIVALQEVSRGWVISARLDMLTWLSQRLGMPYLSGPTADPFWGNALLSKFPIVRSENRKLLPLDLPIRRGYLSAVLDLGAGESLQVIATHFHHSRDPMHPSEDESDVRQLQTSAVIESWNGATRTILLGDFNARPSAPEMSALKQAGLLDVMEQSEPHNARTWRSDNPTVRIDYMWVSPDLKAISAQVLATTASDHLPVIGIVDSAVTLER